MAAMQKPKNKVPIRMAVSKCGRSETRTLVMDVETATNGRLKKSVAAWRLIVSSQ